MWFRNLRVYTFSQEFSVPGNLQEALVQNQFTPCNRSEPMSLGWVSPFAQSELMAVEQKDAVLLCLRKEEKVVPASAVKEELEHRKTQFEQENAYAMPRKDQKALKEDIMNEMMPRALSKFALTWGIIDIKNQRVYVDSSSAKKAEEFTSHLRTSLGSLPVQPFASEGPASLFMTDWVKKMKAPDGFEMGQDAELKHLSEDSMVVKIKGHDLDMPEVQEHLKQNKRVTELAMSYQENILFSLADDYGIKRIKFTDQVMEQRDTDGLDAAALLDSDLALMQGEFSQLVDALAEAFGQAAND
ncbi:MULTISPECIES: recombination-associated protein RdgC [Gammaproteobacteria]|uniref:recombination-associated protein RdgC n=1 Tax=Gammaproteobacteria TaxID=1236 RepID=UPI000DCFAEFC|nr:MULTISPECIES: recombination-associated protein RdgC [Gammaproteobacteria]RTE85545.1 recombination-associated protein RdgC [Aliidiomarina sp. B3213]TCZ89515.1 recombination-associated protein RdgC [Lysobacter sp. N42]